MRFCLCCALLCAIGNEGFLLLYSSFFLSCAPCLHFDSHQTRTNYDATARGI
jgi:hypothetical protein